MVFLGGKFADLMCSSSVGWLVGSKYSRLVSWLA